MSLIIIVGLTLAAIIGTRKVGKIPNRFQGLLETIVSGLMNFVEGITGPGGGKKYTPFIGTLFIYITLMDIFGIIPFMKSGTANLSTTVGLAITAIIYVHAMAIREIGFVGWIKHFLGEPLWLAPLMFPLHLIGEIAKPISLSLRLFGNIFGEDTILVIVAGLSPVIILPWLRLIPVQFPIMAFAVFTGFVQALIFSVLTAGYLAVFIGEHGHEGH